MKDEYEKMNVYELMNRARFLIDDMAENLPYHPLYAKRKAGELQEIVCLLPEKIGKIEELHRATNCLPGE